MEELKAKLGPFFEEELSVNLAYLFGSLSPSYTGSGYRKDMDLAFFLDPEILKKQGWLSLKSRLRDKLSKTLQRKDVDLVFLNTASLAFRYQVLREGFLLFERCQEAHADFASNQILEYLDWLPYQKLFEQSVHDYFLHRPSV